MATDLRQLSTTDDDFGAAFKKDPAEALAAKGIEISPDEATRIKQQVAGAAGAGPAGAKGTEISVSVKVKF